MYFENCKGSLKGIPGYSNNTIRKYLKTLRQFLNWSYLKEFHHSRKFDNYTIKSEEGEIYPLSEQNLAKILSFVNDKSTPFNLRSLLLSFYLCVIQV